MAGAYRDAAASGHPLPPGTLVDLQPREFRNQRYLLERAQRYGGIFKAIQDGGVVVCVADMEPARRLLSAHEDRLRPASVPLETPFPKGLLRVMEGEDHRRYRHALNQALQTVGAGWDDSVVDRIVSAEMADYAARHSGRAGTHADLTGLLSRIATGCLVDMFFGTRHGTAGYQALLDAYSALGPDGYEMKIGAAQALAFDEISRLLIDIGADTSSRREAARADHVLASMQRAGTLDATALGNLIYMVEIGRYDLHSLFRWMLKRAADAPQTLDTLATIGADARLPMGSAFVLEALRLSQSERLIRRVKEPFVFDGYCFPKDAWVRICLWEAHKSPAAFAEPFVFDPGRFQDGNASTDGFAPFGLGRHRCPMANPNVALGARFITALAHGYRVHPVADEPPNRGRHHWEPGAHFTVRFEPRQRSG